MLSHNPLVSHLLHLPLLHPHPQSIPQSFPFPHKHSHIHIHLLTNPLLPDPLHPQQNRPQPHPLQPPNHPPHHRNHDLPNPWLRNEWPPRHSARSDGRGYSRRGSGDDDGSGAHAGGDEGARIFTAGLNVRYVRPVRTPGIVGVGRGWRGCRAGRRR
jgi:hypothetical protein